MGNASASYQQAKTELRRLRGSASEHTCICGKSATDWAYQFTAGDAELRSPDGSRPYSTNPDDYAPMCRSCHVRFDMEHDPVMAERRRRGNAIGRARALEVIAEKRRTDPEYAERRDKMLNKPVQCGECDLTSTPGGLGNHQAHTGHRGRKELG